MSPLQVSVQVRACVQNRADACKCVQCVQSPEAFKFNCAQRAHQQTLEVLPLLTLPALISGLKYPIPTAIAVATWSVSRIFFTRGYISGGPKKRGGIMSGLGSLAMVGLILTAAYTSGTWALGGI
ncbi:hypothetical protein D9613_005755 [Agrocybe pediades]|uniref:Uncharacterized protein n=1 Tax=Agrocybe pediades TaxID=84607 RepID=A0A8H4QWB9_9AGAR|nr:hypothetical protein D9613_005755 [Agrocybe pediades]